MNDQYNAKAYAEMAQTAASSMIDRAVGRSNIASAAERPNSRFEILLNEMESLNIRLGNTSGQITYKMNLLHGSQLEADSATKAAASPDSFFEKAFTLVSQMERSLMRINEQVARLDD